MVKPIAIDSRRETVVTVPPVADGVMHFRFEINFIVDEITGPAPVVRILEIAWLEKRHYIREYLLDYHARYRQLPQALHDLGSTPGHHLRVGVVDFDRVRVRIRERLDRRNRGKSRWARWFGLN